MTREEKLQAIDDMGINVLGNGLTCGYCPSDFGLKEYCKSGDIKDCCPDCWIKALEVK